MHILVNEYVYIPIYMYTYIHIDKRQTGKLKLLPGSLNLWD